MSAQVVAKQEVARCCGHIFTRSSRNGKYSNTEAVACPHCKRWLNYRTARRKPVKRAARPKQAAAPYVPQRTAQHLAWEEFKASLGVAA